MPSLNVTTYTAKEFDAGPKTPAAALFHAYVHNVDTGGYNKQSQGKFYSENLKFINCNGVVYYGYEQMTTWMRELFAPFESMKHTHDKFREIDNEDGTYALDMWSTRNIWIKGKSHDGDKPDVSVPFMYSCLVGPDETVNGAGDEKLRILQANIYWDTGVLSTLVPAESVVFRQFNPYK